MLLKLSAAVERFLSHQVVRWALRAVVILAVIWAYVSSSDYTPALVLAAFIASIYAAIPLGRGFGALFGRSDAIRTRGLDRRLGAGATMFLFLFLPVLVYVSVFEGRVELQVEHAGLLAHFIWASLVGLAVFWFSSPSDID